MSAEPFLKIAQNKGLLTGSRLQASLYVCSGPVGLAATSHQLLYWRWGLLRPTPTLHEPLVERLSVVSGRLLAHTLTYFRLHTIDGVFGNIRKLTGSGWQLVLDTGINFIVEPQCHFFCTLYIFSFGCLNQTFAIWQC